MSSNTLRDSIYSKDDLDKEVQLYVSKSNKYKKLWIAISVVAMIIATYYLIVMFIGSKCYIINNYLFSDAKSDNLAYPVARNNLSIGFILLIFISHLADQISCGNVCVF